MHFHLKKTEGKNGKQKAKTDWKEHIERMAKERLPKQVTQYKARGLKHVGEPMGKCVDA